jgi:hypothetical protein
MEGVGTNLRAVLQEAIQDVHGFPHPTGHKAAEQGNIGIGYMVVADALPPAVPQVVLTQEVLFIDVPLGAIRGSPLARAPEFGQEEAIIPVDHAHIGLEEFLLGDMALIDVSDLEAIEVLE